MPKLGDVVDGRIVTWVASDGSGFLSELPHLVLED